MKHPDMILKEEMRILPFKVWKLRKMAVRLCNLGSVIFLWVRGYGTIPIPSMTLGTALLSMEDFGARRMADLIVIT